MADWRAAVRALIAAGEHADGLPGPQAVAHCLAVVDGLAGLQDGDRELLRYTVRLALRPRGMTRQHVDELRQAGFSDREIHDIDHVVCCFSYMNRLADGLGVGVLGAGEGGASDALAIELFGEERLRRHAAWARRHAP